METGNPYTHFNKFPFRLQADSYEESEAVVVDTQLGESVVDSQTVTFIDNEGGVCVNAPLSTNSVALVDNTDDISLGNFLARPTLIDTTTWTTSDILGVKTTLQPWHLFLNNTLIKKKLDNYAFLRGNLHIKIILNGTPFQYGAVRACYSPLLGFVSDKITVPSPINPILVPYSQQPGLYVYPQANAGGEMVLPFFLHKNWLDITSAAEVQNMGTLNYLVYAPLKLAVTGGTTTVTLRTYAWMTDVHLMGSTNKLALQGDEYGNGPVSRPASALASVAAMLTKVPIIGKFARATEIGASATASIASLFGFTNVPVIDNVHAFQPANAPHLSSAHISTAVQKLSLDPKQELSIDPSPHGIGSADELSLAYLKAKESYFASTSWSTSDAVGTQLWNARVNPYQPTSVAINNASAVEVGKQTYHVPLSYIGNMFKHWRGDIIIRIKVVCTKFHKGRLKISYDPISDISISDPPENAVYTQILDIGEDDDVELRIPYHQALAWLAVDKTLTDNWSPGNALAPRAGIDNGLLTVRVLTALTAPASSTINLLFFIRGGDNFEYANTNGNIGSTTTNIIPSFFQLQAEDKTNVLPQQYVIGKPSVTLPERYAQNFGECIGSLRNVLHRSVVCDTVPLPDTTGLFSIYRKVYKRMPYTPGYDPNAATSANKIVAASGTSTYAFNTMPHVPYIAGMYLGYRGSVNYTVTPSSDFYGSVDDISVSRNTDYGPTAANRFVETFASIAHGATSSAKAHFLGRNRLQDGTAGAAITTTRTNGSVQFNLPDYNNYNFSLVDPTTYVLGTTVDGTRTQSAVLFMNVKNPTAAIKSNTDCMTLSSYIAAGPDFTCLFFLCCPTLFAPNSTPTPV